MQLTALVVEFVIPGILLITAFLGIADYAVDGKISEALSAANLSGGAQAALGALALTFAYVVGVILSMELYRLPLFKEWYQQAALKVYKTYEASLKSKVESMLGLQPPDEKLCERQRADAVTEIFDRIWGLLRHRFKEGISEYRFAIALERLCRGYMIACPFLIVMVVLEGLRLSKSLVEVPNEVVMWVATGVAVVLGGIFLGALHLLKFAVELEYYYLVFIFLSTEKEQSVAGPGPDRGGAV